MPELSVVVVGFRRYDLLAACIDALLAGRAAPHEIVVVDNEADPARLAQVARRHATVRAIANEENLGYAAACNQGWRASRGRWVLFLNPDVKVAPDTVAHCLEAMRSDARVGLVTCRLVRPDGRLDHACHRGLPTPSAALAYSLRLHRLFPRSRRLGRYTMSWLDTGTAHDVEACSGAFMLIRRDVLEALDGWDERYWFYAEDLDLCLRAGRLGWRVRYLGDVTAVHQKGASSLLRDSTRTLDPTSRAIKRRVQRAIIDSHDLFFRQHFEATTRWPARLLVRAMFRFQRARLAGLSALDGRQAPREAPS